MSQYETTRGLPRIVSLYRCSSVALSAVLDKDPWADKSGLLVQRSLNGTGEAQPTTTFSEWTAVQSAITAEEKDKLYHLFDQSLDQGEPVDFYSDGTKLLHMAAMEERCVRTHRAASGSWTRCNHAGQYRQGGLGVFENNPGSLAKTNYLPNGDFLDGTTGWTATGNVSIAAVQYLPPGGRLSYWGRIQASDTTGSGTVYVDSELESRLDGIAYVTVSFLARAERNSLQAPTTPVTLKLKAADGSGSTLTVGTCTPTAKPQRFFFTQALSGSIGTVSDLTLRTVFDVTNATRTAPVYITEVQVEVRRFATGFVPYSTTRTTATGSRATDESLRFVNPIEYALQQPLYAEGGRLSFTISFWFESFWAEGSGIAPASTMYLVSTGQQGTTNYQPIAIYVDQNGYFYGTIYLDDGTPTAKTVTSTNQAIALGSKNHLALTYRDWDGSSAGSGSLKLYLNGTLAESETHSSYLSGAHPTLFVGTDAALGSIANGVIHDLTVDGVYIGGTYADGTTCVIGDFYDASNPPHRERTGGRFLLMPGSDKPAKLSNNLYQLGLKLFEVRLT